MATIDIDTSEVTALVADMRKVDDRLTRWVKPAVEKGAVNIKNQLREEMADSTHFKGAASAISYDMLEGGFGGGGVFEAEIGPTKGKPGSLANIAYFGTSRGGGTVPEPSKALMDELPNFTKALEDLASDLVFG